MAEIPIERKEGRNWLPLLLGLAALLLLAFFLLRRNSGDQTTVARADSTAVVAGTTTDAAAGTVAGGAAGAMAGGAGGDAVSQFAQFVDARDTTSETEARHQYTAEGVRRLATALESVAGRDVSIQTYADSMRGAIDRLQRSGPQDRHADDAKAAFNAAVTAMTRIDQARGRTRDVAPMRAIAAELDGSRPLVPQLPTVHRFFAAARDALRAMGDA